MLYSSYKQGLVLFLIFLLIELNNGCPISCICKWKNGKQTVECIDKELLVIPEGMDSTTQVLEFCGNNLHTLHRDKFLKMDLINLQRIYLCRCRITTIDENTFKGLTNLVELDLSENLLENVPSETFFDCPSLMRLTLSYNPIKVLKKSAFNHLTFLTSLELKHCEIDKIEEGAFHGLFSLEWLYLNENKITTLQGTRYFPESLKAVNLQDNPWECDCHILELHTWLMTFNFPHSMEPQCWGPKRLKQRTIKSIPSGELACIPDINPTTFYLEIGEGKNVSLLCQVHAIPEAQISWKFDGQLLQNDSIIAPGMHLLYFIENGGIIDKQSQLFIYNVNTDDNGTFICNAENMAGTSQANFTIRVLVKQQPLLDSSELSLKFILIIMSVAAVSVLILLFAVVCLIKCHRSSGLKEKRNSSKVPLSNSTKDNLLQDSSIEEYSENYKENSCIKLINHKEEETTTMLYSARPSQDSLNPTSSSVMNLNQICSPTTSERNQLEQNPDLINGTEFIERHPDGPALQRPNKNFQSQENHLYMLPADVHLNPVSFLNTRPFSSNCYKTLPYNRCNKRQSAANPLSRYSREAEFLMQSNNTQPASYEHFSNIRYTADGYPVPIPNNEISSSSPTTSHKSDSAVQPCCSKINWPYCVPANLVKTKCVGAQTDYSDINVLKTKIINKSLTSLVHETLTECPDEKCAEIEFNNNSF